MKRLLIPALAAATFAISTPVSADPSFGFGVTITKGGDVALGLRVFSTDKPDSGALALGLDYKFNSGSLRPNAGIAYLDRDVYVDFSLGFDMQSRSMDYGVGLGGLGGMRSTAPAGGGGGTPTSPTGPTGPTGPTDAMS